MKYLAYLVFYFISISSCMGDSITSTQLAEKLERLNYCRTDSDCLNTGIGIDLRCQPGCGSKIGVLINKNEINMFKTLKSEALLEHRKKCDPTPKKSIYGVTVPMCDECPDNMCAGSNGEISHNLKLPASSIKCIKNKCMENTK